jgi:hypothetical protein
MTPHDQRGKQMQGSVSKTRRGLARAFPLAALAVMLASIFGATAAQAASVPSDDPITVSAWPGNPPNGPGPVCDARTFCVWPAANFGGLEKAIFSVPDFHSQWFYFIGRDGFQPNSAVNNSGSAVYFYDKTDNVLGCIPGYDGTNNYEAKSLLSAEFGYFFITYNEPGCIDGAPAPLP